jgi:hypothetical protein
MELTTEALFRFKTNFLGNGRVRIFDAMERDTRAVADQFTKTSSSCGFEADSCNGWWQPQQQSRTTESKRYKCKAIPRVEILTQWSVATLPLDIPWGELHGLQALPIFCDGL